MRKIELSRTTKVTKEENGMSNEYLVSFDDLEQGDLLGRGQFGTVKKMFHQASSLTFAVKVWTQIMRAYFVLLLLLFFCW